MSEATQKFQEAAALAAQGLLAEAATAFRSVVDGWPDDELADDALYDTGACYLAMSQFRRAAETFQQVVERYPDAAIRDDAPGESGRTAAKAWLGIVAAQLGMGDVEAARRAGDRLADYSDSTVTPPDGLPRSYHDVALTLLSANAPEPEETADEVGPDDVVADG